MSETLPATIRALPCPFAKDEREERLDPETGMPNPAFGESATTDEPCAFTEGFGEDFDTPLQNGGPPVMRWHLNELGYLATFMQFYLQCGGLFQFNAEFAGDPENGDNMQGYAKGAVLDYVVGDLDNPNGVKDGDVWTTPPLRVVRIVSTRDNNYTVPTLGDENTTPTIGLDSSALPECAGYVKTRESAVVAGRTYYTRTGDGTSESPYVYTEVDSPVSADIGNYYEQYAWACVLPPTDTEVGNELDTYTEEKADTLDKSASLALEEGVVKICVSQFTVPADTWMFFSTREEGTSIAVKPAAGEEGTVLGAAEKTTNGCLPVKKGAVVVASRPIDAYLFPVK